MTDGGRDRSTERRSSHEPGAHRTRVGRPRDESTSRWTHQIESSSHWVRRQTSTSDRRSNRASSPHSVSGRADGSRIASVWWLRGALSRSRPRRVVVIADAVTSASRLFERRACCLHGWRLPASCAHPGTGLVVRFIMCLYRACIQRRGE